MQVNIKNLIDDVQCYQTVRELCWPDGVACPSCQSKQVIKHQTRLFITEHRQNRPLELIEGSEERLEGG